MRYNICLLCAYAKEAHGVEYKEKCRFEEIFYKHFPKDFPCYMFGMEGKPDERGICKDGYEFRKGMADNLKELALKNPENLNDLETLYQQRF